MIEVRKEKFLFHNNENKILCFIHNDLDTDHIYFLGNKSKDSNRDIFYQEVMNLLGIDNCVFLYEVTRAKKLKDDNLNEKIKIIKDYYSSYYILSRSDIKIILDICHDYDMIPEYFSINELIDMINKSDVHVSKTAYEPLNELQKRLKLQKY